MPGSLCGWTMMITDSKPLDGQALATVVADMHPGCREGGHRLSQQLMTTGWIWSSCRLLNFCKKTNRLRFRLCPNGVKNRTRPDLKPLDSPTVVDFPRPHPLVPQQHRTDLGHIGTGPRDATAPSSIMWTTIYGRLGTWYCIPLYIIVD
jgi:hypothetical protein